MEDFGFIILRHISEQKHDFYWRECIRCIRNFYNQKIIVIDDNSKLEINNKQPYDNVEIVKSEFPGCGEVYGYYYGWKYTPFKHFIVLHDSMFLKEKLPVLKQKVIFLWHFDKYLGQGIEGEGDGNPYFIKFCKEETIKPLLDLYYEKSKWYGCFGVTSLISFDLVDLIFKKYDFENCIKNVKTRHHREAMERVFALICFLEESKLRFFPSICGNILQFNESYNYTWDNYVHKRLNGNKLIIKVWSGR
jgi:hypothetical protein